MPDALRRVPEGDYSEEKTASLEIALRVANFDGRQPSRDRHGGVNYAAMAAQSMAMRSRAVAMLCKRRPVPSASTTPSHPGLRVGGLHDQATTPSMRTIGPSRRGRGPINRPRPLPPARDPGP